MNCWRPAREQEFPTFSNLDSRSATELLNQIRRAVDEYRQTVVMVTHDACAAAYADRVLFLADGRLVSDMRSPTADRVLDTIRELTEPRDGEGLAHRPTRSRDRSRRLAMWRVTFAMAGFAGLAGIVAAIAPSRRAARLDILRAVTTE